jgi:hypothetical protein
VVEHDVADDQNLQTDNPVQQSFHTAQDQNIPRTGKQKAAQSMASTVAGPFLLENASRADDTTPPPAAAGKSKDKERKRGGEGGERNSADENPRAAGWIAPGQRFAI